MTITISLNPAKQRLAILLFILIAISAFSTILIEVGKVRQIALCKSNITIEKTCWDWKLQNYKNVFKCPFTSLFLSLLLFMISLLFLCVSGFAKCLCPEIVIASHRVVCCRMVMQYYAIGLHFAGSLLALSFIVFVLIFSYKDQSCYYSGDILRNCSNGRTLCWMLILTCLGFFACLFATMFSAFEARKFYVERLDDDRCDQFYQEYIESYSHESLQSYPVPID